MMQREKIIYSTFLVVVIVLAWTVASFYVINNSQNISLEQEHARVLAMYSKDMWTQTRNLGDFFLRYYQFTEADQNQPNITENFLGMLESRSFTLLNYEARSALDVVKTDSQTLSTFNLDYGAKYTAYVNAHYNVSVTVEYAVNQLDWTTSGRLPTEHHQLMYGLCHILGADQYMATGNTTQLPEISQTFFRLYLYWDSRSKNQQTSTLLDTELGWAVGNATQLHQNLLDWHNQNPQ
jgi:hypothetical protein